MESCKHGTVTGAYCQQCLDERPPCSGCEELQTRLSTLLKASEGMEKALELLINHTMDCEEDIDKLSGMGNDSGSGSSEYVCAAKQALADFRAVKEGL